MIGVTRLLCGTTSPGDALRYGRDSARLPAHLLHYSVDKKPIVVWNCTRRCNLHCMHCYADSHDRDYPGELTTAEGIALIDELACFGVPTLLFSGGEPLLRADLLDLAAHAAARGLRIVLSSNGTLLSPQKVEGIRRAGFSYVGVSLDGIGPVHDRFRGMAGAFEESLRGIRRTRDAGLRVGLRFTLNAHNRTELPRIFDLLEEEGIPRLCVYHLAYAGRGNRIRDGAVLPPAETRAAVEEIFARAEDFHRRGVEKDILTVDNHADGVLLYLRVREWQPERVEEVHRLLLWNGGNNSGIAIAAIDNIGDVHPDQFWQHHSVGNVRQRPFSAIWTDPQDPILRGLKDRKGLLKGRCSLCRYLDLCNGNLRVRAEAAHGDVWGPDPACYLTDEEIARG